MTPSGIITLTTDFGLADNYVAQLHGVILTAFPTARIVDISHEVPPGHIDSALFLTETAWPHFPAGTVHLVIVDPGVGSDRRIIAVQGASAWFVGPDNGVLSSAVPELDRPEQDAAMAPISPSHTAIEITQTRVRSNPPAPSFQGRDIMAPVPAHLARGEPFASLGDPLPEIRLCPPLAATEGTGRIIHIDHFGNAITNFRSSDTGTQVRFIATTGWRDEIAIEPKLTITPLGMPVLPEV